MAQQTIVCDFSLKEWGDWLNANCGPRTDDDVTRDLHGQPMSAEQILEIYRQIEAETGEVLIKPFRE